MKNMCQTYRMERNTLRKILAEMYGCQENALLAQFENMMPQIRNDAILTLSIDKPTVVAKDKKATVSA